MDTAYAIGYRAILHTYLRALKHGQGDTRAKSPRDEDVKSDYNTSTPNSADNMTDYFMRRAGKRRVPRLEL